jgi:pyruvate-formate lyase-activating enzyme
VRVFEWAAAAMKSEGLSGNWDTAVRRAHRSAIYVFAEVHQGQESAENTGFKIVCERKAAGGDTGEGFAVFGDEAHDFALAFMRRVAERGLAAHGGATGFERQREMQNADAVLGEGRGRIVLASCGLATSSHLGRESRSK